MKLYLQRVRLNQGGYDDGGTYWGVGQPLYYYHGDDGIEYLSGYLRADDREDAKAKLVAQYRNVTFYR